MNCLVIGNGKMGNIRASIINKLGHTGYIVDENHDYDFVFNNLTVKRLI